MSRMNEVRQAVPDRFSCLLCGFLALHLGPSTFPTTAAHLLFNGSSNKEQFVGLFNTSLLPQVRKIRAANAGVKCTSRGIEDITKRRKGTGARDEFDDEIILQLSPNHQVSNRRAARKRGHSSQHSSQHSAASVGSTHSGKQACEVDGLRRQQQTRRACARTAATATVSVTARL